jgi:amidase
MPILTHKFDKALGYASEVHRLHLRKGTDIPYLSHLMGVSSLVLEYGGDEDQAIAGLLHDAAEDAGATIIDPCDMPSAEQMQDVRSTIFATEFKASLNAFLKDHGSPGGIGSLADLIAWNDARPEAIPYGQSLLLNAEKTLGLNHPTYINDRDKDIMLSRTAGIDAALDIGGADVLIAPMGAAAKCTGKAGAPTLAIPVGLDDEGTPFGVTLYTRPNCDQALINVGRLVEAAIGDRRLPAL